MMYANDSDSNKFGKGVYKSTEILDWTGSPCSSCRSCYIPITLQTFPFWAPATSVRGGEKVLKPKCFQWIHHSSSFPWKEKERNN